MIKISDAELEVMNIIWSKKEVTSEEIIKELGHNNWNDSTIRTLIGRLSAKKVIGVSKKRGRLYVYISLIDETKYKLNIMKKFINEFFHSSFQEFVEFLIREDKTYMNELTSVMRKL